VKEIEGDETIDSVEGGRNSRSKAGRGEREQSLEQENGG
jgi:hypothetical protein